MNIRKKLVEAGKRLYNIGLVAGTSGNISMRNLEKKDSYFITPSSLPYNEIKEEDIVEINSKGEPYIRGQKPSSEWQMHTHSTFATAFAVIGEKIPLILVEMKPFLGGDLDVAPYKPAGSRELGKVILPYLENRNSCLLANHGTISCGTTLEEAFISAEYVEDASKIYYYAKTAGKPKILDF